MLITISNTRSKRVNENITRHCTRQEKNCCRDTPLQPEEDDEEHGNSVKIEITSITPVLQAFLQISFALNMFSTLVMV